MAWSGFGRCALEALGGGVRFYLSGVGLGAMQRLGVPGEDAKGVMNALELIAAIQDGASARAARDVVVIGRGEHGD
jgi:NADPH-dependent glutamate synthase beta subunit-like oxidoreductase